MAGILTALPCEILNQVVSQLLLPDQSALSKTCKFLHAQLTPIVWQEVELHHRGVHEGLVLWELLDEAIDPDDEDFHRNHSVSDTYPFGDYPLQPSSRKYAQCPLDGELEAWRIYADPRAIWEQDGDHARIQGKGQATDNANRHVYQFGREQRFLGVKSAVHASGQPALRWTALAAHVQSLCMSIAVDEEVCLVLADLRNLRSLQLVGLPLEEEWGGGKHLKADSTPYPPLPAMVFPALRRLRLRGYIPTHLVREIVGRNGPGITHLDLGLVAGPREDKLNAMLPSFPGDDEEDEDEDDDDDDNSSLEEYDDEKPPWGLHSPHWLQGASTLPAPLSSLTHLCLVKPYTGEVSSWISTDSFSKIPSAYDQVVYDEWAAILDSAASTLQEVILEHRVVLQAGDTVGDGDPHPERKGSQFFRERPEPDTADVQFCQTILRRLRVGGRAAFPYLQHLGLRGIRIREIPTLVEEVSGGEVPGVGGVPDNEECLRAVLPAGCDVELFEPTFPIHVYAGFVYQNWSTNRHEASQDPGDGLLHDESFFHDYRRRFGPDWRIGG